MIRSFSLFLGALLGLAVSSLAPYLPVSTTPSIETVLLRQPYTGMRARLPSQPRGQTDEIEQHDDIIRPVRVVAIDPADVPSVAIERAIVEPPSDILRLQIQLSELGCFDGVADGRWSPQFHERLARVAMTRELDLERLGTVDKILTALADTGQGNCGPDAKSLKNDDVFARSAEDARQKRAALNLALANKRHPPIMQIAQSAQIEVPRPVRSTSIVRTKTAHIVPTASVVDAAPVSMPIEVVEQDPADLQASIIAAVLGDSMSSQDIASTTPGIRLPSANPLRGTVARRGLVSRSVKKVRRLRPKPVVKPKSEPKPSVAWKHNRAAIFRER